MKLSFLTVTHAAEFPQLYFQAKSLALFAKPTLVEEVVIVLNERIGIDPMEFLERVRPYYGHLSSLVKVLSWADLDPDMAWAMGWHTQQACKLLAARDMTGAACIILDSKNFFIRPIDQSSFADEAGKLISYASSQGGLPASIFDRSLAYFGVSSEKYASAALPNVTPIPVRPSTVRELIRCVEQREGCSFSSVFLAEANRFAEFYLLSGYVLARDGGFDREYTFGKPNVVTLFLDKVASPENFDSCMWQLAQDHVLASGIHHQARSALSDRQKSQFAQFLLERGLDVRTLDGSTVF